ncbi:histidine phosphatase family protein [Dactylosporangium vinaceum]|uniref:Histidine phosphatase family protein n=1 Tax=Dactylosporangium vinaceum TaxID=53362 RepID=A0ABV5M9X2_9ACTN|nr:histidine phosphatase family protein [Dactylosporangium vinaceum]UAB93181.1 histidine phosphatase family protein [Dactylosporangium vinaceum]
MAELGWLGVVRHGQSVGNVRAQEAEQAGLEVIDLAERDADVPLTDLGREQAEAVGRWIAELPPAQRPEFAVVSPYLRTRQTAAAALGGTGVPVRYDERLRDRELGVLDLLTARGVAARFPAEAERRRHLGKLYYRPPGGESWSDVLLRLRSLMRDVRADHPGGRVLLVGHEAIVLLLRYLIEGLQEHELMAVARSTAMANCSVTSWVNEGGILRPERFNAVEHLHRDDTPPTRQEDVGANTV